MIVVLANGCFDVLHAGHINHLLQAKRMGNRLIVALTSDDAVNKGPGRPVNNWYDRAHILLALRCVDDVVPSQSSWQAIRQVRPHIFVKGIDYFGRLPQEDVDACIDVGAEYRFTTSVKMSSTEIIKRMAA